MEQIHNYIRHLQLTENNTEALATKYKIIIADPGRDVL